MVGVGGIFVELTLVFVVITLISGVMRLLNQPLIIGYILSGVLVSPQIFGIITGEEVAIATFSNLGVALLLFLVGLHINPEKIKDIGKVSVITGLVQIILTFLGGFLLAWLLNFDTTQSLYIAGALTFSSTIVIMKLLSDNGDTESLYGKISIGVFVVQDFVVMILLLGVSALSANENLGILLIEGLGYLTLLLLGLFLLSRHLVPKVSEWIAESQEFLLLSSVSWCLVIASVFYYFEFSYEIGALLAGVALSYSAYRHQISSRMKILRDFFIILFFIVLGSDMQFGSFAEYVGPAILFSLFVFIGKFLIVMSILGYMGYKKKTSFFSGLTVAQISEFSLIFVSLGVSIGHVNQEILSLVTLVGLITMAGSSYFITYNRELFQLFSPYLDVFERKDVSSVEEEEPEDYELLLFGHDRIGYSLIQDLIDEDKEVFVVDYDPHVIEGLRQEGIPCMYGDAEDIELLIDMDLTKPRFIVSTIPEDQTNELILKQARKENPTSIVVLVAQDVEDALDMYAMGADYVLIPHFIGGSHTAELLQDLEENPSKLKELRQEHLKELEEKREKLFEGKMITGGT